MRFSESFLDEIRDRVPISAVIGPRVSWDRKKSHAQKGDWWACCPFHGEKSPSFHCEDRKGRYHCFGCGVSGDHFRFLTEHDGLSFPEAVEKLAEMAGVPMPVRDADSDRRDARRATLHDVMEMATAFFEQQLQIGAGAKARAYLRERGLTTATQQAFRLGYAPDSRNALKEHLAAKGVAKDQIEACGLVVHGDDIPVSYDRFRDRIMFPIPDSRGKIIAFGGRAMAKDAPAKYLNSPETEIFRKGEVLFNFARARPAVRDAGTVIAVEGYMDVIALAQAGIANAVAPLGTALTEKQLDLIWRMSDDPIFAFDGDKAGQKAAFRIVDLVFPKLKSGKSVKFAMLEGGNDPDDFIRQKGSESFRELLKNAIPLHEFFIQRRKAELPLDTPEHLATFEKKLYDDIEQIADSTIKRYYRSHVRLRIYELFGKRNQKPKPTIREVKDISSAISNRLEKIILGICVEYPGILSDFIERLILIDFESDDHRQLMRELYRLYIEYAPLNVADIYEKIDPKLIALLDAVHGFGSRVTTRANKYGYFFEYEILRGHRIRRLFPMLKFEPPIETVKHTVTHLLLEIDLRKMKSEYERESRNLDFEKLIEFQRRIHEFEELVRNDEAELDGEYQDLAGRTKYRAA